MPTAPIRPTNISLPFSASGAKNTIPDAPTGTNNASFTEGFPPVTMLPMTAGGIPPSGKDFNGILYDISSHTLWVNAGGQYRFDSALSTAMGGYPAGMVLQSNDGLSSYVSAVDNNTIDFNSTPSSIGVQWLPYGGNALSNITVNTTGGNATLTVVQATARLITVTGTLASNATITVPAAYGRWTVINNTTGAYNVTVLPSGGTGVPIFQGKSDSIYSDGSKVDYFSHSSQTRSPGDSTKHNATTEFVTNAINGVKQPSTPWLTKKVITATGNFTVPVGVFTLRAYAFGQGGTPPAPGVKGGAGGGCAWGEIAVTPGQVIAVTINSTQTLFGTYLTATAASGITTAGTGSKDASVLNGGTATGGVNVNNNAFGGASSGSPLGNGVGSSGSGSMYAGSSWGVGSSTAGNNAGCGIGGVSNGEYCGGPGGPATASAMGPQLAYGSEFTDPLLADCNLRIPAIYATGSTVVTATNMPPGFGGNSNCKNGGLGSGGYGSSGGDGGNGGFGGGGGGSGVASGKAGNGGFGGGGGSAAAAGGTLGTGGPGAVVLFY